MKFDSPFRRCLPVALEVSGRRTQSTWVSPRGDWEWRLRIACLELSRSLGGEAATAIWLLTPSGSAGDI